MNKINIAGAGLAGLSAAISIAEAGFSCNLISLQPSERAQSVLAEGGINAALNTMGEGDTPEEHFQDTMKGGAFLADPNAVEGLAYTAPEIIEKLLTIGTPFQMDGKGVVLRNFGGQKKKRTVYAKSSTGKVIMTALIDEGRKYESSGRITRYPHHQVLEILSEDRICRGLKILDTYTDEVQYLSGPVIIACGGLNGFFPEFTTGTVANTGDLAAELFSEGVEFANLEFIQYHPTTVAIPGKRMLISEAARGEGGRLFIERSGKKWYFMEELYPELGNLMPRDVISREMTRVLARDDCEGPVCLDMTGISKKTWEKKLSDLREEIREYLSIDPAKEPVSVYPGIHFFMGGIRVDEGHKTSMENLFAAGECVCQYHGANRLGGNSMLGAIYGGRIAAQSAMKLEHENYEEKTSYHISAEEKQDFYVSPKSAAELKGILADSLGIIRNGDDLNKGIERIDNLLKDNNLTAMEKKRILLGKAMILSALAREESRGAHFREDYPEADEAYRKTTVSRMGDGIEIYFRDIPERRESHEIQN